jgi:hypothetical protein
MKAVDPLNTIELNIRAITQVMRNAGLAVRRVDQTSLLQQKRGGGWLATWWAATDTAGEQGGLSDEEEQDHILDMGGNTKSAAAGADRIARWVELEVPDAAA